MGVGLATSPRLDRIHLAEREACPGQLKWAPLIQWKSGLKRPVDSLGSSVLWTGADTTSTQVLPMALLPCSHCT